mgnify:CR=1 FL=1
MDDFRNLPFVRAVIGIQSYNIGCDAIAQFIFAFIVLFAIIAINILFDMIGTAVQSAEEKPFIPLRHAKSKVQEKYFRNTSRTSACKLML